jgi:hypothetical protein
MVFSHPGKSNNTKYFSDIPKSTGADSGVFLLILQIFEDKNTPRDTPHYEGDFGIVEMLSARHASMHQ